MSAVPVAEAGGVAVVALNNSPYKSNQIDLDNTFVTNAGDSASRPYVDPATIIAEFPDYIVLRARIGPTVPAHITRALGPSGESLVAKRFIKWKLSSRGWQNLRRSEEIHSRLSSQLPQYCVRLLAIRETEEERYHFLELLDADLLTLLEFRPHLCEAEVRHLFRRVCAIVRALHDVGVTHRDLKLENFLVKWCPHGHDVAEIKLTDFELSAPWDDVAELRIACGSPAYASPELVRGEVTDGRAVDVWSLGVLLYALLCGSFPWSHQNTHELFHMIEHYPLHVPDKLGSDVHDLLERMLTKDEKNRIRLEQLPTHPWLSTFDEDPRQCADCRVQA